MTRAKSPKNAEAKLELEKKMARVGLCELSVPFD